MARKFEAVPAIRKAVPLLVGIAGPPGAGKTYSALELATGIKAHRGGPIVALDTERNRMLSYAPPAGIQADGVNHFDFMHVPFAPPFGSVDFLDAVMQQRVHKPSCIIIDSFSDEHEGDGGLLDYHDTELDRMAGEDYGKRQAMGQAAWIKPKQKRLEMMNGLFQIMTPLIFCFRAREKTKQVANDRGKMVPTNIGWTPIAPPEIVHNMTLFALLPIKSDGVPMWKGNTAYEDFSIKLPRQFQGLFPEGDRITRKMGHAMSVWALGDQKLSDEEPRTTKTRPAAPAEEPAANLADQNAGDALTAQLEMRGATAQDVGHAASAAQEPVQAAAAVPGPDASADAESSATAAPAPADSPFADYASAIAGANDWPQIKLALGDLLKTDEWRASDVRTQSAARSIGYTRLKELVDAGYGFDIISDLHAYRCYIEWETDTDALVGIQRTVGNTKLWLALSTEAKVMFDKAHFARLEVLKRQDPAAQEFG